MYDRVLKRSLLWTDFNVYIYPARVTLASISKFRDKKMQSGRPGRYYFQNTLPQNVIVVERVFFR